MTKEQVPQHFLRYAAVVNECQSGWDLERTLALSPPLPIAISRNPPLIPTPLKVPEITLSLPPTGAQVIPEFSLPPILQAGNWVTGDRTGRERDPTLARLLSVNPGNPDAPVTFKASGLQGPESALPGLPSSSPAARRRPAG